MVKSKKKKNLIPPIPNMQLKNAKSPDKQGIWHFIFSKNMNLRLLLKC